MQAARTQWPGALQDRAAQHLRHTHTHTHTRKHARTHTQEGNSSDGEEKEEGAKEVFNETNGKNTNPLSPAKSGWKKPRGFRITNLAVRGREVRRQWFGERARQSCCATAPDHGMDKENDDAVQAIGGGARTTPWLKETCLCQQPQRDQNASNSTSHNSPRGQLAQHRCGTAPAVLAALVVWTPSPLPAAGHGRLNQDRRGT